MCINCLKRLVEKAELVEDELNEINNDCDCEVCKNYNNFCISVYRDMKTICLTKIKKSTVICRKYFYKLSQLETTMEQKVKNKLEWAMEQLEEEKDNIMECIYINKMNDFKVMYDFLTEIDEANHR